MLPVQTSGPACDGRLALFDSVDDFKMFSRRGDWKGPQVQSEHPGAMKLVGDSAGHPHETAIATQFDE